MPRSSVQVQLDPEYIKWPRSCVCCGGLDERDMEIAVFSTDPQEHESNLIMSVHLPYCLACYDHSGMRIVWPKIVAVFLALSVGCLFAGAQSSTILAVVFVVSIFVFIGYVVFESLELRRAMKRSCSAARNQVVFVQPTDSRISTLIFTNDSVAQNFREVNRYSLVEL